MSEERDIPTLEELSTEVDATVARLDKVAPSTNPEIQNLRDEIKNTLLPLIKDLAASTSIGLIYVQDLAEPVELSGAEADEAATLLKAFAESQPLDKALQERIAIAVEPLLGDDGEDDEDEEGDPS